MDAFATIRIPAIPLRPLCAGMGRDSTPGKALVLSTQCLPACSRVRNAPLSSLMHGAILPQHLHEAQVVCLRLRADIDSYVSRDPALRSRLAVAHFYPVFPAIVFS